MIAVFLLALGADDMSASRFFPLVAGNHWVYEDTLFPGSTFESLVKPQVVPPTSPVVGGEEGVSPIEVEQPFYPVELRKDGQLEQVVSYREKASTLLQVGNGPNHPITARKIMVVSRQETHWDFYGDNPNPINPDPPHFVASAEMGKSEMVLGQLHDTLIVKITMTYGPAKSGIELHQVWHYAADVGLFEMDEDGRVGKTTVHHVRKLTKFEAGGTA